MAMRTIFRIQFLLPACYLVAAILLWPTLPERLPLHFDINGQPTDWVSTSILSWFGLPVLAVAMSLFLYGLGRLASRSPDLWNIPEKKLFLALPPEKRAPIEAELQKMIAWISALVTLTFVLVHIEIYRTALGQQSWPPWLTMVLILAPTLVILLIAIRSSRDVGRQIRQEVADQESGTHDETVVSRTGH